MPPFRDDHILIISPGSTTVIAQLGLPESFTPAKVRIQSRMFPGIEEGTWTPTRIREMKEGDEMLLGDGETSRKKRKTKKAPVDTTEPADANGSAETNGATAEAPRPVEELVKPIESNGVKEQGTSLETKTAAADTTMPDADADAEGEDADEEEADEDDEEAEDEHDDAADEEEEHPTETNGNGEKIYYEDDDDEEGAVWCLKEGKVADWGCFFALLTHVHELINPTFHTPILMLSQPCWTHTDKERICQFVFEKLKAPGFALLDSAAAVCWAHGVQTATVIDVGYEKTDVTPVIDYLIQELARITIPVGGNSMNVQLKKLLPHFSDDQIEQLKQSNICEILPVGVPLPGEAEAAKIAAALAAVNGKLRDEDEDDDGVMNIAAIVAAGKTHEFLAKKEKEKADKKAGTGVEKKQPNYRKEKNSFFYVDHKNGFEYHDEDVEMDGDVENMDVDMGEPEKVNEPVPTEPPVALAPAEASIPEIIAEATVEAATENTTAQAADIAMEIAPEQAMETSTDAPPAPPAQTDPEQPAPAADLFSSEAPPSRITEIDTKTVEPSVSVLPSADLDDEEAKRAREKALKKEEKRKNKAYGERRTELEVGVERFKSAEGGILHDIADAVYRTIVRTDDIEKRSVLWENLIIVGNGSRTRGFKDGLLSQISAKYLISPSSSTIFTSDMPSHFNTPGGTGANTPQYSSTPGPSNSLQYAAIYNAAQQSHVSSIHYSQTPTSIRTTKVPEYFPEWKDAGFEECSFLGAQVAAKVLFVVDQGVNKGFLTRVEYNENGPQAIHSL